MTRKQFFKEYRLDQPRDKKPFTDLVKKHKGVLSYSWMDKLVVLAYMLGRRGDDILGYIDAVAESKAKDIKARRSRK